MAFKMLINQPSNQEQLAHKIHGLIQLYKNKHHLYVTSTGMGRSRILAAAIADTLTTGSKIYLLVNSNKEDMLLRIAAALADLNYKDLKNPNYRNKPEIQSKLNEISKCYDSNLEVETYFNGISSKQVVQKISEKNKSGFNFSYVFIEDINLLADENEYAKQMNQSVTNLNSLAEALGVSIVSCSSVASNNDIPGYLLNQESKLVMFSDPPYKKNNNPDFIFQTKSGEPILFEIKENMRVGKTAILMDAFKKFNTGTDLKNIHIWLDESRFNDKGEENKFTVQTIGRFQRMVNLTATPNVQKGSEDSIKSLQYKLNTFLAQDPINWTKVQEVTTQINDIALEEAKK